MREIRSTIGRVAAVVIGLSAGVASANIVGFGNGAGFTANGFNTDNGGNPVATALPTISGGTVTITTADFNESRSVFYNTKQSTGPFTASFNYRNDPTVESNVGEADGFTFTLQNDTRGASAIGGPSNVLGYGPLSPTPAVTPSASFQFYLRQGTFGSVEYQTNGAIDFANATSASPVNLKNGDVIGVTITYNGTTVTETLTDLTTPGPTYTTTLAANIATAAGGAAAYVGFTGGTGGGFSQQTISNFSFTSIPEPATLSAAGLLLLAGRRRR